MRIKSWLHLSFSLPLALLFVIYPPKSQASLEVHPPNAVVQTVHGVDFPTNKEVNGWMTTLNGHGLRRFAFYGIVYDMYVAGLYSAEALRNEQDVMDAVENGALHAKPICFDFVFLRNVSRQRMRTAWRYQMDWSVSYQYAGYERDRNRFLDLIGAMDKLGTESVQLSGDETIIVHQGQVKGTIPGRDFQRAFLSMWFGQKAVTAELKDGLLGRSMELEQPSHTADTLVV